MRKLPFKSSPIASIGVELEIQLIHPATGDLKSSAKTLMRTMQESPFQRHIKPEITQSMIEINTSPHVLIASLREELQHIQAFLLSEAKYLNVNFAGGGTHPFQKWPARKIYPTHRFRNLSRIYRYLTKRATVFGEHIHVGCARDEDALYLTHALARYIPQLIAISASSPFYQGVDTGYHSSRLMIFNSFPLSGIIPYLLTWQAFSDYFYKMRQLKIIHSMKDFYWDIRPKPEFGTVEVRIFDTPLTLKHAIEIAAYLQSLSLYLLRERPIVPSQNLYDLYPINRFQACRYGLEGEFIDPFTLERTTIFEDIMNSWTAILKYGQQLKSLPQLEALHERIAIGENDATLIRKIYKEVRSFPKLIERQCQLWEETAW